MTRGRELRIHGKEGTMSLEVTLVVNQGTSEERELVFDKQARIVVGRAEDCQVCLPTDYAHSDVSRHHCEFEITPPRIRVRDLGSRNGTFVNGEKIGQRDSRALPDAETLGDETA